MKQLIYPKKKNAVAKISYTKLLISIFKGNPTSNGRTKINEHLRHAETCETLIYLTL